MDYTILTDLDTELAVPEKGILSCTLHADASCKAVLFGFAEKESLSEHTAAMPAVIHVLSGTFSIRLGEDDFECRAGCWIHMPAGLPHAVHATTAGKMLLILLHTPAAA